MWLTGFVFPGFVAFCSFGFLALWLPGILASWISGSFLKFWFCVFLDSWLPRFSASYYISRGKPQSHIYIYIWYPPQLSTTFLLVLFFLVLALRIYFLLVICFLCPSVLIIFSFFLYLYLVDYLYVYFAPVETFLECIAYLNFKASMVKHDEGQGVLKFNAPD